MGETFKAACIQVTSTRDREQNKQVLSGMIREAAGKGAGFICTPEYSCYLAGDNGESFLPGAEGEEGNSLLQHYCVLAKELSCFLSIGSMAVKISGNKMANRSFLIDDQGEIVARYDKIHMFDVQLPNGYKSYESEYFQPGSRAVVAETSCGQIGMSICYDVRFPKMYREMALAGAELFIVPAAYSAFTGERTWEPFTRARAGETGSFVLAANQTGHIDADMHCWGHSIIADPYGKILAQADDKPGIIYADIDMTLVQKARADIPALRQEREYRLETTPAKTPVLKKLGGE